MGRPVLSEPDGVVREDVDDRLGHEGGQTDRRTHVIREDEKGAPERPHAPVQRHAVHDRAHRVLADAVVHVAAGRRLGTQVVGARDRGLVGAGEVRRAADQGRHAGREPLDHLPGPHPRGRRRGGGGQVRDGCVPVGRQPAHDRVLELGGQLGQLAAVDREARLPRLLHALALHRALAPVVARGRLDVERVERRIAEVALGRLDLGLSEGRAVRGGGPRLAGASEGDRRAQDHQAGPAGLLLRFRDREIDRLEVVSVVHLDDVPSVPLEAPALVRRGREIGAAVDRDPVVVEDPDQLAQPLMPRDRRRLVGDPLHQVAIGAQRVREVVDDSVPLTVEAPGQPALGQREAHRVGHTLPQGSRGRLHPRDMAELGMARGGRAPLPEPPDVLLRQIVAAQVEQRVQEHRRVARGEHEPVTVDPRGIPGIVPEMPVKEDVPHRRQGHGRARVPRARLLNRVHRQDADRVDREPLEAGHPTTKFTRRSFT